MDQTPIYGIGIGIVGSNRNHAIAVFWTQQRQLVEKQLMCQIQSHTAPEKSSRVRGNQACD